LKKLDVRWEDEDSDFDFGAETTKNGLGDGDFAQLLASEQATASRKLRVGDRVKAVVAAIPGDGAYVYVECDAKETGVIAKGDLGEQQHTLAVGDMIEAIVIAHDQNGLLLSSSTGHAVAGRTSVDIAYSQGLPVKGKVTGLNKGGLEVSIAGRSGFCPMSQIDTDFVSDPSTFIGRDLEFIITQLSRNQAVLSRSRVLMEQGHARLQTLARACEDETLVAGTIKDVRDFGVIVDLGGVSGMVHVSEMGYGRIAHPRDVAAVGDEVQVLVRKIEPATAESRMPRISLSMKAAQADPWETVAERFSVGSSYSGKVTRLAEFGAFVSLSPGIEGLLHVSELSWIKRVRHPQELLKVGDLIEIRLLNIDLETRRLSLSMKSLADDPWALVEHEYPAGKKCEGTVEHLKGFGAIIALSAGVTGLLPKTDLQRKFGAAYRTKTSPGNQLEIKIVHVDSANRRLLLTLPGLEDDDEAQRDYREYLAATAAAQAPAAETRSASAPSQLTASGGGGKIGSFGELLQAQLQGKK